MEYGIVKSFSRSMSGTVGSSRKENAFASVVCPLGTVERIVIAVVSVELVDASSLTYHRLLHDADHNRKPRPVLPGEKPDSPREGADTLTNLTMTSCESKGNPETFSLRTVPVWVEGTGKQGKVNGILDDASNEYL